MLEQAVDVRAVDAELRVQRGIHLCPVLAACVCGVRRAQGPEEQEAAQEGMQRALAQARERARAEEATQARLQSAEQGGAPARAHTAPHHSFFSSSLHSAQG